MIRRFAAYADVGTVMSGTLSRNVLRGVFKLLVAGALPVEAFGILRSVFSFFKILASMAGFGLDKAMVTYVSASIERGERDDERRIVSTVLALKLITLVAFFIVGNLFASRIAAGVFGDPSLVVWVRLAFLAVGGQLLWKFVSGFLSAHQRFRELALFLATMPVLMLVTFGILWFASAFDMAAGIAIYLFAPMAAMLLWWPFVRRGFAARPVRDGRWQAKLLRFGRWVYVSNLISTGRGHLNTLLVKSPGLSGSLRAGELNAGLYGFGADLANEITVVAESIATVLLPRASRKTDGRQLRRFVLRAYRNMVVLIAALIPLVFLAKPLLLVLGRVKASYLDYLPSVPVFAVLYCGSLLSVAAIPMQTALYAMKRPHVETYIEGVTFVALIAGSIVLIPRFGAIGAAYAVLAQRVLSFLALTVYGFVTLRRMG